MAKVQNKAILVPVDFTEAARHALRNAIAIGQKLGSEIYIVNFIPPFSRKMQKKSGTGIKDMSLELSSYMNLLKENEEKLCEMLKMVEHCTVPVHSEIKIDKLSTGIKKQLCSKNIGLVVIGAADAHTIGDSFFKTKPADPGCIDIECPLMICNNIDYKFDGSKNIVVSLDFNAPDQDNIERLTSLISKLSLNVFYLHINHPSDQRKFTREDISYYLSAHNLKADSIQVIDSDNKDEAIKIYANEQKAGFIAINKFNKSYNFEPYHTEQVVHDSENLVFVY